MSKKIMVIDDDQGVRSLLQRSLSTAGYQVETVDRGATGLQKLLSDSFDMVMIDINMPEISGPAVCAALRKHEKTKHLPVVMITAMYHSQEQIDVAKAEYGPDDFLLKPFTDEDLLALVGRLLNVAKPSTKNELKPQPLNSDGVPRLLHQLYIEKATGLLTLQRGEAKKVIYIKDGYPIFARSNVLNECLGRMLVREGEITLVDCDQSVEKSKETGRLQGTVLIEMGLLTPQQLHEALARQVVEKLLNTFSWGEGYSLFKGGQEFKKTLTTIKLSPASLILRGITQYWTHQQLDEFLRPYRHLYLKQSSDPHYRFQEIELSKRGAAIFAQCRGALPLEQLLERHPLARREVQQVLSALLISEMVVTSEVAEEVDATDLPENDEHQTIDEELRRKILDDYQRIMQTDYFAALGISRQCGGSEVRRAYYKLAKEYHPDRFLGSGLSREMSSKIKEMFQHITQAYSVLSNPKGCSEYLEELINGPKKTININEVIEAETAFQEGRMLFKVRRFSAALKPLKKAIELSPEEPEYLTHYAWALFKSSPEQREIQNQALEVLIASRELNPSLDATHLYLGHIYQLQGKDRQAEKSFEMAVQANPDCTEALRELRLINLRREQASQSKGLLKKFMHKDD